MCHSFLVHDGFGSFQTKQEIEKKIFAAKFIFSNFKNTYRKYIQYKYIYDC